MHQVVGRKGVEHQAGRWLGATGQLSHIGKEQRGGVSQENRYNLMSLATDLK